MKTMTDFLITDSDPPSRRRSKLAPTARPAPPSPLANPFFASPDWWGLRAAIMKALQDFPEARDSVLQALRSLGPPDPANPQRDPR